METVPSEGFNITIFVLLVAVGVTLFGLSLFIRARSDGKYEIRPVDLILVLAPVFLWLFGTGKITKLNIAGVGLETAQAFVDATERPITYTSVQTPEGLVEDIMHNVEKARKAGVDAIPQLIKKRTEALEFQLGFGGYWGPAIEKYFETLGGAGLLRYVLIYDKRRELFGAYDSQSLLLHLQNQGARGYRLFAQHLNKADEASRKALQELAGFVSVAEAATRESNKRVALETMQRLKTNILPVVDKDRRFIGMVDRNEITASLIIDVTRAMEKLSPKTEGK